MLVGGLEPWNFESFPQTLEMSYSQLTNSLHDFSEGLVETTDQKWCILRLHRIFVGDSDDQPKDLGIGCFPPRFRKQPCKSSGSLLQFVFEHGPLIELIYL